MGINVICPGIIKTAKIRKPQLISWKLNFAKAYPAIELNNKLNPVTQIATNTLLNNQPNSGSWLKICWVFQCNLVE